MKKIMALLLAAVFALSLVVPALAVDLATFSLTAAYDDDYKKVAVTVNIDSVPDGGFTSYSWILLYDKDAFSIGTSLKPANKNFQDNYDDGACISLTSKNSKTAGQIKFNCMTNSDEPFEDEGKVCTFWFDINAGAADGEYTFTLKADPKSSANAVEVASTTYTIGNPAGDITAEDIAAISGMSTTVTTAGAEANIIIRLPDGADASKLSVTIGGAPATLVAQADGSYKISTGVKAAKAIGDEIAYTINYGESSYEGTTSIAAYAQNLAASEDASVAAVGNAMLAYGAAAQKQFEYNVNALVSDAVVSDRITAERFDASKLNHVLAPNDYSPVTYSALNVTYETEITLSMALRVKDGYTLDAAAEWVAANFKIDGKDVAVSTKTGGGYKFVVISVAGIAVEKVCTPMAITVDGADAGNVCPANYLASVEAAYGNKTEAKYVTQVNLARALFAYANALAALD